MTHLFHRRFTNVWLIGVLILLTACATERQPLRLDGVAMGTPWSVTAYADAAQADELRELISARLEDLEQQMSAWRPESALSRFNTAPANTTITLPDDLFAVIDHALALARDTDGVYDPTITPLVDLWGFGASDAPRTTPPSAADIEAARQRVGWQRLLLDRQEKTLLQPGDITLDVNSLGPGYGVDAICELLDSAGIGQYLVELGGEMRAAGRKPDNSPWRIAVEAPGAPTGLGHDLVVELQDMALGTSGDYRASFIHEGKRYSHTIDPRTGAPIEHSVAAVTVIDGTTMAADARAGALLALGLDDGMAFAEAHDLAAVFTLRTDAGPVRRKSPAFEQYIAK